MDRPTQRKSLAAGGDALDERHLPVGATDVAWTIEGTRATAPDYILGSPIGPLSCADMTALTALGTADLRFEPDRRPGLSCRTNVDGPADLVTASETLLAAASCFGRSAGFGADHGDAPNRVVHLPADVVEQALGAFEMPLASLPDTRRTTDRRWSQGSFRRAARAHPADPRSSVPYRASWRNAARKPLHDRADAGPLSKAPAGGAATMTVRRADLAGARAIVLHRRHLTATALTRQLAATGPLVTVRRPILATKAPAADVASPEAEMGSDDRFACPRAAATMPLMALLGLEAPGRVEWAPVIDVIAQIRTLAGDGNAHGALLIARHDPEARSRRTPEVADLHRRFGGRQTVVPAEPWRITATGSQRAADTALRATARKDRITLEEPATRIPSRPARPVPNGGAT